MSGEERLEKIKKEEIKNGKRKSENPFEWS